MISKLDKKQIHNSFKGNNFTTQLFRNIFYSIISDHQLRIRIFKSSSHENFITRNFYLPQFPMVMDQFSATEIFNTSMRDLPRPRLIQKRRNLLTLLKAPDNRMDSYISTLDHTTKRNQESNTNRLY